MSLDIDLTEPFSQVMTVIYGKVTIGEGTYNNVLVLVFPSSLRLAQSLNAGFTRFSLDDDTLAVILTES